MNKFKLIALIAAVLMMICFAGCGSANEEIVDFDGYKVYAATYAEAGAPTDEEKGAAIDAIEACATVEDIENCEYLSPMFSNEIMMTYEDWVAAGSPAADVSNMVAGDPSASGEPTERPVVEEELPVTEE